jgi:hypothetical protein
VPFLGKPQYYGIRAGWQLSAILAAAVVLFAADIVVNLI